MSLTVSPDLLAEAHRGEVSDKRFIDCIRESLPYAYQTVVGLIQRFRDGERANGTGYTYNTTEPPDEQARGQLLRLMASDAMRSAFERHFGIRLAFQNCHAVGVFSATSEGEAERDQFTSNRAQLLNQSPELVNC